MIGYLYWSLTDNYEFGNYDSRFGRGVGSGYTLVRAPAAADCAKVVEADRAACLAAAG